QKPEEILAITFTKKAAAEMRKRILKELPNSGEIAHRLRIQTIDAFCTALTRQLPVLARFGAQPEIVEDARELYFEAASRVFQQFNPASEKLLAHLDNDIPKATRLLADRLWEALEAILALLKPAVAHLKVLFGERGQADFTEFAHGALAALGSVDDPSDLLLSLDQKISHVLVDEFQDTSLSQFELLTQL